MKRKPTVLTEEPLLPQTVEACHAVMREWWVLMQEMRARLLVLEEQVKLNSRTSSKPPSSDGPGRGSRSVKPKSDRKVGAQPGHKGSFRVMVPSDQVDQQVLCRPEPRCTQCQGDVIAHHDQDKTIRHQVFDLPPITSTSTHELPLPGRLAQPVGHKGGFPPLQSSEDVALGQRADRQRGQCGLVGSGGQHALEFPRPGRLWRHVAAVSVTFYSAACRLSTSTALVPPNAKELDSMVCPAAPARAALGT